jgi:putative membrane protein
MGELLLWTLLGAVAASLLAVIPALHIYNVAGLLLALVTSGRLRLGAEPMAFLLLGLVTGYAMVNTIPGIFFSAPDESMLFVVLPGQSYVIQRRGYEAVFLVGLGGLGGLALLVAMVPVASRILPVLRAILSPHLGWLLWTIIAYVLVSEWPKGSGRVPVRATGSARAASAGWRRWWDGWRSLVAGLATFLLSGVLGFILLYRSPLPVDVAYQNLLPAFVGLFAVPWVIFNLLARTPLPPQHIAETVDVSWLQVVQGIASGALGGFFAAFFPVVTGGIGGLLAGHATAQRDNRTFLIAQGAAKMVYYVGGLLLFFVPGLHLTRGGMAWMISTQYTPYTPRQYLMATAAALIAGVLAFLLSLRLARGVAAVTTRVGYRGVSWVTLGLLILVVLGMTGPVGLGVCAVATGIGLIPALWGARRLNAMGVLLLPLALNMAGVGDAVAGWLRLLH